MLDLRDPFWKNLKGGYKQKFDASIHLLELEKTNNSKEIDQIFKIFWKELYHQGDVGLASYYTLPHLIRIAINKPFNNWNIYGLIIIIELARQQENNPKIPENYLNEYEIELKEVTKLIYQNQIENWDDRYGTLALSVVAVVNQKYEYAELLMKLSHIELKYIKSFTENYDSVCEWMEKKDFVLNELTENQLKLL